MRQCCQSGIPRTLLAAGLVLSLAVGCGGSSKVKNAPTTVSPPPAAPATTLAPVTTPTTLAIPDTTGTDLVKVMENLSLLLNLASERADLSLLDLIYTPDAEQRKIVEKYLRELVESGRHYDDSTRSTVTDITVKTPLDGVAVVDLVSSQGTQVVKDSKGVVVATGDGWTPRKERYGLFRSNSDGRWRIRDYTLLGPA